MDFPSARFKDNPQASTGLLFMRAYNKWHTIISKQLRTLGLTHPRFVVLTTLNYLSQTCAFVSQAAIAKMADMDVMSVSQIINGLERDAFVTRIANPEDSRANAVILLPKGQDSVARALPLVEQIDDTFFGTLQADETILRTYLQRLTSVQSI
ncbi:MAG: MarR family transcriptional regulator [Sporolactobacillus sp.]